MKTDDIKKVFTDIKEGYKKSSPICIFDLDSTLYDVSPRTQAIIRDFGRTPLAQEKFPTEAKKLLNIEVFPEDWGFTEALEREDFHGPIVFFKELNRFWRKHFFTNQYMAKDRHYVKAVQFVKQIYKTNYTIYYLTGRNKSHMLEGSLANLKRDQFPWAEDSPLIMKENKKLEDQFFKSGVIQKLKQNHDHILYFENEPTIINQIANDHPEVRLFYINSTHSRREVVHKELPTIHRDYTPLLF